MKETVSNGKPDAGNKYVRVDAWISASARPGRSSLLCKKTWALISLFCAGVARAELPEGYEQLDAAAFDSSAYVNTGVAVTGAQISVRFQFPYFADRHLFGQSLSGNYTHFTAFENKWFWGVNASQGYSETNSWTDGLHELVFSELGTGRIVLDGQGVRTTFFMKGCPLKCIWCHNPESLATERQTARFQHLCRHCAKCTMDEATCPTRALKFYGTPMTIDAIVAKALEDKPFYATSGGGVTLSGGEPLFFWEWAVELFTAFKKAGLHTCLDTSLYAPPAAIEAMLPLVDMWLPDYKAHDPARHRKYTGVPNTLIRENLERLVAAKAKLEVRLLVVPGCTDGDDRAARHAYLDSLGIPRTAQVELEYRDLARSKYLALGMPDTMPRLRSE